MIRDQGPISRAALAKSIGLSKPTVNEVVEALLRDGTVVESIDNGSVRPGRPGRRARLLRFRADRGYVLGVDIGAEKLLVLVADLNGDVVTSERRRVAERERAQAEALLGRVREAATAALKRAGVARTRLQAVGVGTPGVVDPSTGRLTLAPQLGGWEGLPLGKRLQRSFSCPVLVDNEVHLAVLAERWRGAAQGIEDALFVQAGYGIGGGLLVGGGLYRGANGAAGEIGYLPFPSDGADRNGLGPFEHACGGSAYARHGREAANRPGGRRLLELAAGDPAAVDAEMIFRAASEGDPPSKRIVEELVARLAEGVAAATVVLDPDTVILGGGLSRAGDALLEPLVRHLRELVPVPPRVVLSGLGEESVALGAVRLAIQAVEERLFGIGVAAV
jgi:predicted NBD/HSP70 family sugar kinase